MFEQLKPLLESGIINESTHQAITEAWESKLNEAREQVRAELHEQFAARYDHDRIVMVEALDRMVTESLTKEISEFQNEKRLVNEDRVKAQKLLRENARKFNDFMVTKLAEEIKEVRADRQLQLENQKKLEKFIVHALARELGEFTQDKKAVVEAKVKLVAEGRKQIEALKKKFVKESASKLSNMVSNYLKSEMKQLKEDITVARQNDFGRKIFESFASEFSVTHLNEKAETRKLMAQLEKRERQITESQSKLSQAKKLIESKEREVRIIKESNIREKTMAELLGPLNEEKAVIMRNLLESVQTPKLKVAFDKYLPAVLNNGSNRPSKAMITESRVKEVTGDKSAKVQVEVEDDSKVIELKRLAGL